MATASLTQKQRLLLDMMCGCVSKLAKNNIVKNIIMIIIITIITNNNQRKFRRDTSELRKVAKRVRAGA